MLDLSRVLAGPWATQLLADYGAQVIKVEQPKKGDDTRHWGPPDLTIESSLETLSAYFLSANRGKRSVAIDLASDQGQRIIKKLVERSDVLVENFKVGGLVRYGLDYQSLKEINPTLVYCSITGFGQTGPYANRPGYDAIIQAMGGLMSITGESDEQGGSPQKVGVAVADIMTGMYASSAILAALHRRRSTRNGEYIDLALLDTQVAWLANQNMNYLVSGKVPQRQGNAHPNIVPYQSFKCAENYIVVAVGNDHQFQRFCKVLKTNWSDNAKFKTNALRVENREELIALITLELLKKSSSDWLEAFEFEQVPCAPINDLCEVFNDPQVQHRGVLQSISSFHKDGEQSIPTIANPVKFSASPIEYKKAPPILGADTLQVLSKLGYSRKQLDLWCEQGVIDFPKQT